MVFAMTDKSILYHYTTQEGFLGIVKDGAIRASSIQHLNDASEFHHASSIVKKVLDETTQDERVKEKIWSIISSAQYSWDAFVTSFSTDGDQLGQWRAYGQAGGFSIGFSAESLTKLAVKQGYGFLQCNYSAEENEAEIRLLVQEAIEKKESFNLLFHFLNVAPKFKHPSFIAEKEWRLVDVRQASFIGGNVFSDISYRPGKSFFVPYRDFALTDPDEPEALLPISKVFVGPTPHADLSVWTVRNCLRNKGLIMKGTKVEKSNIPYRNW
jgi:hypothetical protein